MQFLGNSVFFLTRGDKDVGEDDEGGHEEAQDLRQPPPQEAEHPQSHKLGGKIHGSKDELHHINTHLRRGNGSS